MQYIYYLKLFYILQKSSITSVSLHGQQKSFTWSQKLYSPCEWLLGDSVIYLSPEVYHVILSSRLQKKGRGGSKWCWKFILQSLRRSVVKMYLFIYLFFFFCLFGAVPTAYGRSQARGRFGATAAGLHQSHSNTGSGAVSVTYTTAHGNTRSLT